MKSSFTQVVSPMLGDQVPAGKSMCCECPPCSTQPHSFFFVSSPFLRGEEFNGDGVDCCLFFSVVLRKSDHGLKYEP